GQQTEARAPAVPLVTDWSHQHLVFSNQNETNVSFALQQEPRYWQQRLRRNGTRFLVSDSSSKQTSTHSRRRGTFKRDWSVSLGPGGTVGAGHYPAKFSFDINSAHCASDSRPDYVVFNTSVAGSSTQATIVAFDNLYSGCTGTVPSTYWAY